MKQTSLLLLTLLFLSIPLFAHDYSRRARYLFRKNIPLKRIQAFLKEEHSQEEKRFVLSALVRYRNSDAVAFSQKLATSDDSCYAAMAAFPLIQAGYVDEGFEILNRLTKERAEVLLWCFYAYEEKGVYGEAKAKLYKTHKERFIPFLITLAEDPQQRPVLRERAIQTLLYLGERKSAYRLACTILDTPPDELAIATLPRGNYRNDPSWTRESARNIVEHLLQDISYTQIFEALVHHPILFPYLHTEHPERNLLYIITLNLHGQTPPVRLSGGAVEIIRTSGRFIPHTPYEDKNSLFIEEGKYKGNAHKTVSFSYPEERLSGTISFQRVKDQWIIVEEEIGQYNETESNFRRLSAPKPN